MNGRNVYVLLMEIFYKLKQDVLYLADVGKEEF